MSHDLTSSSLRGTNPTPITSASIPTQSSWDANSDADLRHEILSSGCHSVGTFLDDDDSLVVLQAPRRRREERKEDEAVGDIKEKDDGGVQGIKSHGYVAPCPHPDEIYFLFSVAISTLSSLKSVRSASSYLRQIPLAQCRSFLGVQPSP